MKGLKNILLKKLIIYSYIFLSIFTQPLLAAGVVRDQNRNQQVNVEKAPNGVPIVNINAPNNNGVSHNYFKEYNVEKEGILLNNSAKEFNRTQIGGIIQGNSNLNGREANVILTEVTGVNRSKIEGYTEIVGKSAEYILANPNGIYLNGAGFINTPRVILTTGKSITDELGDLKGFSIDDGTVIIGSQGIDGKNVRMVDIISRTAELNGAVYGGEKVNVVLGRNDYDHQTKKVTPKADKAGDKPKVALDAKALGSLYAGRIYLQSTEKGVGVNSQGEMLAGAGDFEVDVNGRLVLNDAQAKNDIKIKAENVEIQKKAIAENDININTKDIVNTGVVAVNKNIIIKSSNMENNGNISSKSISMVNKEKIVNTGKISADNIKISSNDMENKELTAVNADIDLTGNLKTESIKAVKNLNVKGKNIENTGTIAANKKVKIESTNLSNKGDISADEIKINNQNNIVNEKNIIASSVDIISKSLVNKETVQGEILNLKILYSLNNNGTLLGKTFSLEADKVINTSTIYGEKYLTITADKYVNKNSGITAGEILSLSGNVENDGNILGEKVVFTGSKVKNTGNITGENTLQITSDLNNSGTVQGKNLVSIIGNIDNSQNIKSEKVLNIFGNVINTGYIYGESAYITGNVTNSGNILALLSMKISGNIINNKNLNSGDKLILLSSNILNNDRISALDISITGVKLVNNGMITGEKGIFNIDDIENYGTLYGKNTLSITGNNLINNKLIQGSKDLYINSQNIENKDDLFAGNNISLTAVSLNNTGRIIGEGNLTFNTTNSFTNSNLIQGNNIKITGVDNNGKIVAKEGIEAAEIKNNGIVSALKSLKSKKLSNFLLGKTILGENLTLEEELLNKGIISVKGDITAKNVFNTGNIVSDKNIVLKELDNSSGTIEGKNINIVNTGTFNNQSGKLKVFDNDSILYIKALDINNNSGEVHAQGTADINIAGNLVLTGSYIGNILLKITADSLTSNINLENGGDIVLNLSGNFLNNNKFVSGNNITITAKDLINNKTLGSLGNFNIVLTGKLDNLDSIILGNGNNIITTAKNVNNSGFLTSQNNLTVNSKDLINNGQIASGNILNLNSNNITNNNFALLYSKNDMFITAKKDLVNNKGDIYSGNNVEIKALGKVQNNTATIEAIGNIYIEAAQIENLGEVTGSHSVIGKVPASAVTTNVSQQEKDRIKDKFLNLIDETNEGKDSKDKIYYDSIDLEWIDKIESNYTSTMAYISSGKNITLKTTGDVINREGNILANKDINITASTLKNENFVIDVTTNSQWKAKYYKNEFQSTGGDGGEGQSQGEGGHWVKVYDYLYLTEPFIQKVGTDKATKISAGNNINISAVQVGNGALSSDPNAVNSKNINVGQVILNSNNISKTGTINTESFITIPEGDKGLFIVNKDLVNSSGISVSEKDKITIGNGELIFNNNSVSNNKTPGFSYLIESNVKFTDMGYYMGSDYFFGKIGFNPEKNIRLLGDAFYESRVVNRAILESTGKRYLNGAANEKEQMQILLDNSIKAMEDFNLSIGTALTKEQINNLKSDIIWYVEEEVNGVNVLVPKVYLSKETLVSLGDNQTGMMAGNGINISAVEVNNTGHIKSDGSIAINTEEFLNKSVLGDFKALIAGNDIEIVSVNDIKNIGAEISADNNISLESIKGSIWNTSTSRENTNLNDTVIGSFENVGEIKAGNNISITAADTVRNTGAVIEANEDVAVVSNNIVLDTIQINNSVNKEKYQKETIENVGGHISSNNVILTADNNIEIKGSVVKGINGVALSGNEIKIESVENYSYEKDGGGKNYTVKEKTTNIGSTITGENISISADKNINIKGSNIVANKNINMKAKENINIIASVDSEYFEQQKTKKKSFGRGKTSLDIKYDESINASNIIAGNNADIVSGKNVNIVGSDILSESDISISAGDNVNIVSALKGNADHHQSKKTGFLGLSGSFKKDVEVNYTNVSSNIGAVGNIDIKSEKGNTNILASNLESGKNITVEAGNNVNILAGDDVTKKESQKSKSKTKFFGSADNLNFEIGLSTSIEKNKKVTYDTKVVGSSIESDGNIKIISKNNTNIEASNISGNNTTIYAGNELNITAREEIHSSTIKNEKGEIKLTAGINLSGIKDTIDSVKDTVVGIKDLPGVIGVGSDLISGKGINESLAGKEDSINALNNLLNGPSDGGVGAGIYAGIELSKDKNTQTNTNKIVTTITSKNDIDLKTDKGDMNFEGTKVIAGNDIKIDSGKNININSAQNTGKGESSSEKIDGKINLATGQISGGVEVSKGSSNENTNSNAEFIARNEINVSGKDLVIKGGNIVGDKVKVEVDNLVVESLQDKSNSKNTGVNIHGSSDNSNGTSTGAGLDLSDYNKEWVTNQSSIIGKEKSEIKVSGNTHLEGGLLGGKNTILETGSLTFNDIKDSEKGTTIGIGGDIYQSSKQESLSDKKVVEGSYSAVDKEQITHATIGNGTIIINGKEENPEGLNRDESKAQEIIKDINVDTVNAKYNSQAREWAVGELESIMSNHIKNGFIDPVIALNETFDIINSKITPYKVIIEKDENGNLIEHKPISINPNEKFEENTSLHVNGMNTDFDQAVEELIRQKKQIDLSDAKRLENIKAGTKLEFILIHNETNGFWADLYESAIDRYGTKGGKNTYTEAAKQLGEILWLNKDRVDEVTAFSQGTLIYGAAMHYIKETYGENSLSEIKTNTIILSGSALPVEDFKNYMKENGNMANIDQRVDINDLVGTLVGGNPGNVKTDKVILELENKTFVDYHNGYTKEQTIIPTEQTTLQKGKNVLDKIMQKINTGNYFKKEKKK
ncbi:two-partner secretion domain-containing protein [Fusobacterium ulcerans]|uniref:two-partner secretion domain-containing protein n=1 Tax=Fusobacterium ulcerans TaxID=861 RepID=UPI001D0B5608|nr:hemagglutinin repeat-containing protein [Fusobacterium ulcerans]MCB8564423.1 hemagglutinin repeat-containing protein [Fusobacterium ulcerans]MCB8648594.1 hemagglutinin repeat-containing protein [Fusobacterium ulcerans]